MPLAVHVARVQPVLATRHPGIKLGEALFSDGLTARFLVMNLDPIVVHLLSDKLMPAHVRAVQAWLAANRTQSRVVGPFTL